MASADEYAAWIVSNADKKGTPEFQTVAQAYQQAKGESVAAAAPVVPAPRGPVEQGQLGDIVAPLATSMIAAPLSGLAGIAGAVLPGPPGQGADWVRKTQDAITYQPRTPTGQAVTAAVSYPFEKIAQGADWAGGKAAEATGSPALGAAVNAGIQSLPILAGAGLRKIVPGGETPGMIATREARKASAAQTDAAATAAREAGYALPPTQTNPTLINQFLEGVGGKIKTAQALSEKNQPVSNQLIRQNFGLPPDAPLTVDALAAVRKDAGQAYEPVRGAGEVIASPEYSAALDQIEAPYRKAASGFPKAAKSDVIGAVESVRVPKFDAGSGVDQISIMRENADAAYRSGDASLGRAYKGIAGALEAELERHLAQAGPSNILQNFRDARTTIAQTYTVQKHLQPNGNIDAKGLANELKKKPLTGNIETVAKFGSEFPKAAQVPEKFGGVPMSPFDHFMSLGSLGSAIVSGHPSLALGAALPLARPALRKMLGSDAYQRNMVAPPDYGPSLASRLLALPQHQLAMLLGMGEEQQRRQPGLLGQLSSDRIE